jgi:hypothetical protein
MMNYYRIDVYDRQDPDYCFIERPPEEIHLLSSCISGGLPAAAEYPDNVIAKMDHNESGILLSDFIGNSELSLICSGRVKAVIEKHCGDFCEYLPVSIENHKGRIASSDYFYINPLGLHDCLNLSLSDIKRTEDGKVLRVRKYVFDFNKLKDVPPLFRVPEDKTRYFISPKLADALQEIPELTNLNLEPINVAE